MYGPALLDPRYNVTYPDPEEESGICARCGAIITLASDGAWEDESGACGCGKGEHHPSR